MPVKMGKRFLYRADMEYEPGKGIKRELEHDEYYEKSITNYIGNGSTWDNDEHPFISFTENAGVAIFYGLSMGKQKQYEATRHSDVKCIRHLRNDFYLKVFK